MDGLLVDSSRCGRTRGRRSARIGCGDWADQHKIAGSSTEFWAEYIAERLGGTHSLDEIIDAVLSEMEKAYRRGVPLLPGADEVVAEVAAVYPVAIASGSPRRLVNAVLAGTGWQDRFGVIVCSDDVQRGKPAPDAYLAAAEQLGVPAESLAVFGTPGTAFWPGRRQAPIDRCAEPLRAATRHIWRADRVLGSLREFSLDMLP